MNNAKRLGRREEEQQRDRKSHEESQSYGSFWGKLGGLLAIFGAVFSVTTFMVPVESTVQKLALSVLVVSASSMMYRAVVALLDKKLDWIFAVLVLVTLGLGSWYVVLLVEDRDSTIVALKEQIGTAVEVPTTVNPGRPQPPSPQTSPTSQGATPAESALPQFDLSDVDSYSNGTVKLVVGRGLELDSSSWDESDSLYGEYSDIWFRDAGIFGQRGIQFALLSAGSNRSFATCRDQTSWVAFLDWDQVERGSFACVKHPSGRRGILRINQRPDLDSRVPTVEVSGELWAPVVDR